MFNKELIEKWISALRSGDYSQSGGLLRDREGFCCLGVLCDVVDNTKWLGPGTAGFGYDWHGRVLYGNISRDIWEDIAPFLDRDILIEMNDGGGMSFDQIADYIESETISYSKEARDE